MSANESFHNDIVKASNNPVMIDIIDRMQAIIYLFRKKPLLSIIVHILLMSMKKFMRQSRQEMVKKAEIFDEKNT
ncbi:hypothetical protein GCM10020331_013900 [Ectobacillus funiculus]